VLFGLDQFNRTAHMDPKLLEWQKKELVPLGRFSTPEEQSWMTLLLLHEVGGAYMTGQEYFVECVAFDL